MGVKGTGHIEFFSKDENGNLHKIHDVTEEINNSYSDAVIDKSQLQMGFSAIVPYEISEDRLRMANAKDVTPEEETWKQ